MIGGISFFSIYGLSHTALIVIFIRKSWKFITSESNTKNNTIFITICVKYINCMILPLITTAIAAALFEIIGQMVRKGKITQHEQLLFSGLVFIYEMTTNIIFLHLQFDYLDKCYILLCNPFRVEIKDVFVKKLAKVNIEIPPSKTSTKSDGTVSTVTVSSSPIPSGMAPTKSNDNNPNKLEPDSHDYPGITEVRKIYICRICPLTSF